MQRLFDSSAFRQLMFWTAIGIAAGLLSNTWPRSTRAQTPADIQQIVFATPILPCDATERYATPWTAPAPIAVRRIEIWIGSDGAKPPTPFAGVDLYTSAYDSRGRTLAHLAFDHYVAFTGIHSMDKVFPPEQVALLPAGGQLNIGHFCSAVFNLPSHSQTNAIVSFTYGWPL